MYPEIECVSFMPVFKGTLLGFATIKIYEWNIEIVDIQYHISHKGKQYVLMPKNHEGPTQFVSTIRFIDHKKKYEFFKRCSESIERYITSIQRLMEKHYDSR